MQGIAITCYLMFSTGLLPVKGLDVTPYADKYILFVPFDEKLPARKIDSDSFCKYDEDPVAALKRWQDANGK